MGVPRRAFSVKLTRRTTPKILPYLADGERGSVDQAKRRSAPLMIRYWREADRRDLAERVRFRPSGDIQQVGIARFPAGTYQSCASAEPTSSSAGPDSGTKRTNAI